MSNTQTPRTDAAESNWWSEDGLRSAFIVRAEFARELEREIARLTAERDEMQGELRKAETECSMLRVECGVLEKNAEVTYENHKRIVAELTAERDEARKEAESWQDDALRMMQERNFAERERDDARFAAAYQYAKHHNGDMQTLMDNFCKLKGWEKIRFFVGDDDHAKEGL